MFNIEIKSRLKDRDRAEDRLRGGGAREVWTRRQCDTFFEVPRGWLKLREEDGRAEAELISYVRSTDDSSARPSEYDVETVSDPAAWKRLLGRVLDAGAKVVKERTLWRLDHTRVHLDRVAGLGDFLELETVATEIGLEAARAESKRVGDLLGLDPGDFLSVPYRTLLADLPASRARAKPRRPSAPRS